MSIYIMTDHCEPISARLAQIKFDTLKDVAARHHISAHEFTAAQSIVKKYIQTHDCVLYGGIAIDFALRLKGDKIYEDDAIADYDFFTIDNIATAHELIDIINARIPGANVYAMRAKFIRTVRVSVGANNWVADITYIPPNLFKCIPTLTYDGMRFVHPHMQFSDMHSSLSFPFDNPPLEVVFNRWKKDLARIDKLLKYYIPQQKSIAHGHGHGNVLVRAPLALVKHSLVAGFAAFAILLQVARNAGIAQDVTSQFPIIAPYVDGDMFVAELPLGLLELFTHRNILAKYLPDAAANIKHFAPVLDFFESSAIAHVPPHGTIVAYESILRLVSYVSADVSGVKIRICAIQALLKIFISHYIQTKYIAHTIRTPKIDADVYLSYYLACIRLIRASRGTPVQEYFDLSSKVFGEISIPLYDMVSFYELAQKETNHADDGLVLPPRRLKSSATSADGAKFAYDDCSFMILSGEERKDTPQS